MKANKLYFGIAAVFAVVLGCTGGDLSAVDRVKDADSKVNFTNKQIEKIESEFAELQEEIGEARKEVGDSPAMRGRSEFFAVLAKAEASVRETRSALNQIKSANLKSYQDYKNNLDAARLTMKKSFENEVAQPQLKEIELTPEQSESAR